jgi:hypothetical protein
MPAAENNNNEKATDKIKLCEDNARQLIVYLGADLFTPTSNKIAKVERLVTTYNTRYTKEEASEPMEVTEIPKRTKPV